MSNSTLATIAALQSLVDDDGYLNLRRMVDAARPEASPLHRHFKWDNTEAAEAFRLIQAGQLARRMRVHLQIVPQQARRVDVEIVQVQQTARSFRLLQAPRGGRGVNGGYRMISDIATDDMLATDMVDTLRGELGGWIKRAQDYCDAAAANGRDETILQSAITAIVEIVNEAWPPPEQFEGDQERGGDVASA